MTKFIALISILNRTVEIIHPARARRMLKSKEVVKLVCVDNYMELCRLAEVQLIINRINDPVILAALLAYVDPKLPKKIDTTQ